ncbi:MAG: lytic transglycosylase domain-containing protein [Deltaproteobacteria bacterium]|jgi:soluble lytic murein transglycosylase
MLGAITLTLVATTQPIAFDESEVAQALKNAARATSIADPDPEAAILEVLEARAPYWHPVTRERVAQAIDSQSARHGIDPALVLAMITTESRFRTKAKSSVGAIGLMQLLPNTAESFARRAGVRWRGPRTLEHPVHNVLIGIEYLAWLRGRFDGDIAHAVAAYCYGPMRIRRILDDRALGATEYNRRVDAAHAQLHPLVVADLGA